MSNFEFLSLLFLLNSFSLSILIYRSINKKSPRILLKFFLLPIMLSVIFSFIIQANMQLSEMSKRQIFANLIFIAWCLKSFKSYNYIKALLMEEFLSFIREKIANKELLLLLMGVLKVSFLQMMCFSSIFAINYLSGYSALSILDLLGLFLCSVGLILDIVSEKEIKNHKGKSAIKTGLWSYVRHPNITGIILILLGLQVLALGAVGSEWSLIGFFIFVWIINRRLIPDIETRLLSKFPDYIDSIERTPKLFTLRKTK